MHAALGDPHGARRHFAAAIDEPFPISAFGPAEEGTARAGLGQALMELGETEGAQQELERALALYARCYRADDPRPTAIRRLLSE